MRHGQRADQPVELVVYVFQALSGYDFIAFYVPNAVWVLLFSLGADYNLFVAGRIWEETRQCPLHDAMRVAGSQTSHAIRVAALTLGLSFATLAIIRLASFRELALAMAVGVLLEAFVVRSYLVPEVISLLGHMSLWPRRPVQIPVRQEVDD